MPKNPQRQGISCAKYTKTYDMEYEPNNNSVKQIVYQQPTIENSQVSLRSVFTIIISVVSVLFFCFNVYKEYTENMTEVKIINIKLANDVDVLRKNVDLLVHEIEQKRNKK